MSNMGSFINGKWFMPSSKKRIHNVNPASLNEVVADFPAASSEDALRAIEAAKAAYPGWSSVPAPERGRYIARAATIARQRLDEIARMITLEEGKILPEAKGETLKGINVLEFFAGEGFRIQGSTFPSEVPNTTAYTIAGNGHFIRPTIFDGVTPDMRLFQEEVFGPVLAVTEAKDFDEALRLANNSRYGLTSAIFTNDVVCSQRFINEIHSGMTHINEPTIGGEAQLPFGGIRATGAGDREMSQIGLNFFTEIKTVFVNYAPTGERSMIR